MSGNERAMDALTELLQQMAESYGTTIIRTHARL